MRLVTRQMQCVSAEQTTYGWVEETGLFALASVKNELTSAGVSTMGVSFKIQYPSGVDKASVYKMEKKLKKLCKEQKVELLESSLCENPLLTVPAISVQGIGSAKALTDEEAADGKDKKIAGMSIVQTGWTGAAGMLQLAMEQGAELAKRFAPAFIRQIQSHRQALFAEQELDVAKAMGVSAMRQITEGGIFATLWELAKESGRGFCVDMKQIQILQETIEVCEHFRLNPYQMISTGSFLMLSDDGEALADALKQEGIRATVIGTMTEGNDKIIKNGEETRYLDRPAPDEILKLFRDIQTRDGGR